MSGIARYSSVLLVLGVLVPSGGCEARKYQEREVRIVVPTVPPATPTVDRPTTAEQKKPTEVPEIAGPATRETVVARWKGIETLLYTRKLSREDLSWIVPAAADLPKEVEEGDPEAVAAKIALVRRTIETWTFTREFLDGKLDRTRKKVARAALTPEKASEMGERLETVSRLLGHEDYALANESLMFIQEELTDLSIPSPAAGETGTPSSPS